MTHDPSTTHEPLHTLILEPTLWEYPEYMALADRMAMHGVPGLSVALIQDGQVAWARAYGVREAGAATAVMPETRFQAGSISKAITATAVMRLVQEGRLDLDEDVNVYLRSWQVPRNGNWQPRVTLRHLLSHGAGTTMHGFYGYAMSEALPSEAQILSGIPPANTREVRVNLLPGTQFRYSGGGTVIVQLALVDVLGQPFAQLMRDLMLDPLGMAQSTFEQPVTSEDPSRAAGHHIGNEALHGRWRIYPEMAAAGLWTTPSDLGRWMGDLLRAHRGEPGTLLTRESVRAMATPQIERHVGLGLFLHGSGAGARFGHEGDTAGFQATVFGYPSTGTGFAVMSNSDTAYTLQGDIVRTLAAEYGWRDLAPADRPAREVSFDQGARFAGTYRLRGGDLQVRKRDGALWLELPGQEAMRLAPKADRAYLCAGVNAEILFQQGRDGTVHELAIRQESRAQVAARVRGVATGKPA